jgi:hypothetical protein
MIVIGLDGNVSASATLAAQSRVSAQSEFLMSLDTGLGIVSSACSLICCAGGNHAGGLA